MAKSGTRFEPYEYFRAALFTCFPSRRHEERVYLQRNGFFDTLTLAVWQVAERRLAAFESAKADDPVRQLTLLNLCRDVRGHSRDEPWLSGFELFRAHLHSFHPIDCCHSLVNDRLTWFELPGAGAEEMLRMKLEGYDAELVAFGREVERRVHEFSHPDVIIAADHAWWTDGLMHRL